MNERRCGADAAIQVSCGLRRYRVRLPVRARCSVDRDRYDRLVALDHVIDNAHYASINATKFVF